MKVPLASPIAYGLERFLTSPDIGVSRLFVQVLERVRDELLNYAGTGISVMEISHRSTEFQQIISGTETRLRRLL